MNNQNLQKFNWDYFQIMLTHYFRLKNSKRLDFLKFEILKESMNGMESGVTMTKKVGLLNSKKPLTFKRKMMEFSSSQLRITNNNLSSPLFAR